MRIPSAYLGLQFAGTRYLKRGVTDRGYVANDVEIEQVGLGEHCAGTLGHGLSACGVLLMASRRCHASPAAALRRLWRREWTGRRASRCCPAWCRWACNCRSGVMRFTAMNEGQAGRRRAWPHQNCRSLAWPAL